MVYFPEEFVDRFLNWLKSNNDAGYNADPHVFDDSSNGNNCSDERKNCLIFTTKIIFIKFLIKGCKYKHHY